MSSIDRFEEVTIASGATTSNIISGAYYGDGITMMFFGPATGYDAGKTYTIEVCADVDVDSNSTWSTLQAGDPLADVNPPASGKAKIIPEIIAAGSFRFKASAGVTGDQVWKVSRQMAHGSGAI